MLRRLLLAFALVVPVLAGTPATAQTFPPFTGLVVDAANVLPPETEAKLTTELEALQHDTKRQLVVATIPDLQGYDLAEYGYKLGRAWGVGLKDVDNGIILFIAPNEPAGHRGPRIEVGRGLEPVVTDALASEIITDKMMPQLQAGDVPGAMTAGTDALVQQLRAAPEEAKGRVDAAAGAFDATHAAPRHGKDDGLPFAMVFWIAVLAFILLPRVFGRRRGRASRAGGSSWPIVLWSLGEGMMEGRSGGSSWSGGSSGGGSSWGGGGFSGGGGGSFGGGGASGSW